MNDRAVAVLEQYDIEVYRTGKGRGAILCDTDKGCLIFKEYFGTEEKLQIQNLLLTRIADMGEIDAESIIPNKEGGLSVKDNDGVSYVLKTWREGRECNISDRQECAGAVRVLAELHKCMELPRDVENQVSGLQIPMAFSPEKEYDKHNKELRKVKKFLQQKGQKTWFEISLQKHFDFFLEQALGVAEDWQQYSHLKTAEDAVTFCHGDYQYHNILKTSGGWFLINFEKCLRDDPVRDLYLLMRKLLEKGNWDLTLGRELLETYEKERPLSALSRIDLYYRLTYPEKFWKIANFYFNSGKAWIPGKNQEKLDKLLLQEQEKQHFLNEVFCDVTKLR